MIAQTLFIFLLTFSSILNATPDYGNLHTIDSNVKYFLNIEKSPLFVNECDPQATVRFHSQKEEGEEKTRWYLNDTHYISEFEIIGAAQIIFTVSKLPISKGPVDQQTASATFYIVRPDQEGRRRWTTDSPEFFVPEFNPQQKEGCNPIRYTQKF